MKFSRKLTVLIVSIFALTLAESHGDDEPSNFIPDFEVLKTDPKKWIEEFSLPVAPEELSIRGRAELVGLIGQVQSAVEITKTGPAILSPDCWVVKTSAKLWPEVDRLVKECPEGVPLFDLGTESRNAHLKEELSLKPFETRDGNDD